MVESERNRLLAVIEEQQRAIAARDAVIRRLKRANDDLARRLKRLDKEHRELRKSFDQVCANQQQRCDSPTNDVDSKTAPHVPSGQIPPFLKANAGKKRRKRPGRKPGHNGTTRAKPDFIHREQLHPMTRCPHCDGGVRPCQSQSTGDATIRFRVIEDILPSSSEAVRHVIAQYWCRNCKTRVEPPVTEAMPGDRLGIRMVVLTAIQHYHHGIAVSPGAFVMAWRRLA